MKKLKYFYIVYSVFRIFFLNFAWQQKDKAKTRQFKMKYRNSRKTVKVALQVESQRSTKLGWGWGGGIEALCSVIYPQTSEPIVSIS